MRLKPETLHSKKLRNSARGEECTINAPMCNGDRDTTVLCHFQFEGGVMGGKESDLSAGYGCSACHDYVDRRAKWGGELISQADYFFYCGRSVIRTHKRMHETGVLKV